MGFGVQRYGIYGILTYSFTIKFTLDVGEYTVPVPWMVWERQDTVVQRGTSESVFNEGSRWIGERYALRTRTEVDHIRSNLMDDVLSETLKK